MNERNFTSVYITMGDDPTLHQCSIDKDATIADLISIITREKEFENHKYAYYNNYAIPYSENVNNWSVKGNPINIRDDQPKPNSVPEISPIALKMINEKYNGLELTESAFVTRSSRGHNTKKHIIEDTPIGCYRIFTSCSYDSMVNGHVLPLDPNDIAEVVLLEITKLIKLEFPSFDPPRILLFTENGSPFFEGTIAQHSTSKFRYIYAVVSRPVRGAILDEEMLELCNACGNRKLVLSPAVDQTISGLEQLACILGYIGHQGMRSMQIINALAKCTRFAPMIVNLRKLYQREGLRGRNIMAITAPLFALMQHILPDSVPQKCTLEYSAKCLAFISKIDDICDAPLKIEGRNVEYDQTAKFVGEDIEKPSDDRAIENIWNITRCLRPVPPLMLRQIHTASLVLAPHGRIVLFTMETVEKRLSNHIDVIDPATGQSGRVDIEEFARSVGSEQPLDQVADLIDPERVRQITLVLLDESYSMVGTIDGYKPRKGELTRSDYALQYLTTFANRAYGYRVSTILGLVTFNESARVRAPLSPLVPDFEAGVLSYHPEGQTHLWDALNGAADMLLNFRSRNNMPKAVLRIVVISDGEDKNSRAEPEKVTQRLIENEIVVDSFIISDEEVCKPLAALCHFTRGLAFRPSSVEEGLKIFEQEAFLSIELRELPRKRRKPITFDDFDEAAECAVFDNCAVNRLIKEAKTKMQLSTPSRTVGINESVPSQPRLRRILKELRLASAWPDEDVKVFPTASRLAVWRVFIRGPEGCPYGTGWWQLFVTFPDTYPIAPPDIRFIGTPYHPNISREGRICMSSLGRGYMSTTPVVEIIEDVRALLLLPNFDDPISAEFSALMADRNSFPQRAMDSADAYTKSDYNEFLTGVVVRDDGDHAAPSLADYVPPQRRSPITDKPIDPANAVVASSGAVYDRDEFRQLLSSSPNPVCLVTGRPLTDDVELI